MLYCQSLHQAPINSVTFPQMNAARYAGAMQCFYAAKSAFGKVVLYEDLVADPRKEVEALLEFIGVASDKKYVDLALSAMKTNSQNNSRYTNQNTIYKLGIEEERHTQEIFDIFGTNLTLDISLDDFRKTLTLP